MDMRPAVSIVMAVHNGQRHLSDAVQSILAQTMGDFEFIVIDDGSTDWTARLLDEFAESDPRLRVVHRPHQGLAESLNFGVAQARSELIARMDADDVSMPERLELQSSFMHSHPEIGLLGTAVFLAAEDGDDRGCWDPPTGHEEIRKALIRANQFAHPTVMFRRSTFESLGGYRNMRYAQDYDLWLRFAAVDQVANLPQRLLVRRISNEQFGTERETEQIRLAWRARMDAIERGDYPRSAMLRLVKPAVAARMPAPLRQAARRILNLRAA